MCIFIRQQQQPPAQEYAVVDESKKVVSASQGVSYVQNYIH